MTSKSPDRETLDQALLTHLGQISGITLGPYVVAYLGLSLAMTGSPRLFNGVFTVVLAVLLVGSVYGPGLRWRPSATQRRAVAVASAVLGLLVAFLVAQLELA